MTKEEQENVLFKFIIWLMDFDFQDLYLVFDADRKIISHRYKSYESKLNQKHTKLYFFLQKDKMEQLACVNIFDIDLK